MERRVLRATVRLSQLCDLSLINHKNGELVPHNRATKALSLDLKVLEEKSMH